MTSALIQDGLLAIVKVLSIMGDELRETLLTLNVIWSATVEPFKNSICERSLLYGFQSQEICMGNPFIVQVKEALPLHRLIVVFTGALRTDGMSALKEA